MQQRQDASIAGRVLGWLLLLLPLCLSSCLWLSAKDRVFVYSDPAGGEVWVDGINTGKTTPAELELGGLMGGDHLIEVRKEGYETERRIAKHWDDFRTSQWDEGHPDLVTPAFPLWWTVGDLFFPFAIESFYVPSDLYVRLFPQGTFQKRPQDPQLETER
ncbi:MAG: hypothetical protein CSA62_13580 [Planctomycetota bacterium]|nr:MAG: hypothetical protein CSA62_13580 [Planctomycetota bacterium]